MAGDTTHLKECIKRLNYADPAAFLDFRRQLEALEINALRRMGECAPGDLQRLQGFAQGYTWFLSLIQEALAKPHQ